MSFVDTLPFDPDDDAHQRYVYGTFTACLRTLRPYVDVPAHRLRAGLIREMGRPGAVSRIIVPRASLLAPGVRPADAFVGWYSARPERRHVVFAFIGYHHRRQGVASTCLIDEGIDPLDGPIGLSFWTPMAARIHLDHPPYNLFHDTRDERPPRETQKYQAEKRRPHPGHRDAP